MQLDVVVWREAARRARNMTHKGSLIPAVAGIGLRAIHYDDMLTMGTRVGWIEVHSENYFACGGHARYQLERARERYALSLHGVGLSLASADPLEAEYLTQLKDLIDRCEPGLVSDHLCWSSLDARHYHDLLPFPFDEPTLRYISDRIDMTQTLIGRQILIENIVDYRGSRDDPIGEAQFLNALSAATGCGILLDITNLHVNELNGGAPALEVLNAIDIGRVKEFHLAGHSKMSDENFYIDSHDNKVCDAVWQLYGRALERFGPVPTLVEWDADLPPLEVLVGEAQKAQWLIEKQRAVVT